MRFALLDSDPLRAEHTHTLLTSAGYRGQIFQHVKPFINAAIRDTFDLAIISGGGADIVISHALIGMRQHANAPLSLVMLAGSDEQDLVAALNQGADDCVQLPVDVTLLLARVGALLRRHPLSNTADNLQTLSQFPGYRFDTARGIVETDGECIHVTPKELALALMLFRNLGRQLSRQYLIDGVWLRSVDACTASQSRSLDTHISRIRHKLHLTPARGYQLSSIYSHGYRLDRTDDQSTSQGRVDPIRETAASEANAFDRAPAAERRDVDEPRAHAPDSHGSKPLSWPGF